MVFVFLSQSLEGCVRGGGSLYLLLLITVFAGFVLEKKPKWEMRFRRHLSSELCDFVYLDSAEMETERVVKYAVGITRNKSVR